MRFLERVSDVCPRLHSSSFSSSIFSSSSVIILLQEHQGRRGLEERWATQERWDLLETKVKTKSCVFRKKIFLICSLNVSVSTSLPFPLSLRVCSLTYNTAYSTQTKGCIKKDLIELHNYHVNKSQLQGNVRCMWESLHLSTNTLLNCRSCSCS